MVKKILQTNGEKYRKYWPWKYVTRPNVEPAVQQVATYIKSKLQNEILTASIAQEIEADGNKKRRQKGSGERQWRNKGKGERVRREGVRRARLMKPWWDLCDLSRRW